MNLHAIRVGGQNLRNGICRVNRVQIRVVELHVVVISQISLYISLSYQRGLMIWRLEFEWVSFKLELVGLPGRCFAWGLPEGYNDLLK